MSELKSNQIKLKPAEREALIDKQEQEIFNLENIIKKLPGSIYWKNKEGVYLGCNDFVLEMAGTTEVIGKTDYELPWSEYAPQIREADQNIIEKDLSIEIEERPKLANGQQIVMLTRKAPLKDQQGRSIGLIGISVDITERKRLELALKEAKEKAESANKAKIQFLENMRHDIRTPLIGITGFARIIANEADDQKIKEYADNLVTSSHALLDLLNEILDVIKVNSGETPVAKKKFNLEKRLLEVIRLNQAKAAHKKIDLSFDFDPNIPTYLIGDYAKIHRITLELVVNALNFTEKGHVKLSTQLAKSTEKDVIIKLIVEDTGIGILPTEQEEIFLQFSRLAPSYEGRHKGSGLGLSIVKTLLNEIEGEVYLESDIGRGSKFTCIIPLKKTLLDDDFGCEKIIEPVPIEEDFSLSKIDSIEKDHKKATDTAQNRVLLVEDHVISSMVVKKMLSDLDCVVDIAPNGKMASQLSRENTYDLIFMDIGLPDINGYEVTRDIRLYELNKGTHIPIIALTAHVDEENKQRCIGVGMNAVLSKPLLKEKAEDVLNAFIPYRKKYQKTEVAHQTEEKVVDFAFAKKQLGGNEELAHEMLTMLLNSFPDELEKLQTAYKKEDWSSIQALAHKLMGGAAYCGTVRLKEACSRLETSIKNEKNESFDDFYQQLLSEINATADIIKSHSY